MEEAITLAREIAHPFNLVFALIAGAATLCYLRRGDAPLSCNDKASEVVEREALTAGAWNRSIPHRACCSAKYH